MRDLKDKIGSANPSPPDFNKKSCLVKTDNIPEGFPLNTKNKSDGIVFLKELSKENFPIVFFDPQYRTILEKMNYGNEGQRQKLRAELPQMSEEIIDDFIKEIDRILRPSGHLFLWVDKFILCEKGAHQWLKDTKLSIVDMITWNKDRMGMGYRSRRMCEYLLVIQKEPKRAKGVWKIHNIPDVWKEKRERTHAHNKPINLQKQLIECCSEEKEIIVDPAAGSYSVFDACQQTGRNFLGCDIVNK